VDWLINEVIYKVVNEVVYRVVNKVLISGLVN